MAEFVRRLFHFYPGEEKRAFLFAALAFTWALGVTLGVQFSNALFLLNIGSESLPTAYSLTASGLLVTATFLLYSLHVITPYRIFMVVLSSAIIFYSFVCACFILNIGTDSNVLWFALKVGSYLFFSVVITCFWLFVDQYYHLQDAKRLFGLFSCFIFLGAACTGLVMRSGIFDSHHLVMMILCLLAIAFILIRKIYNTIDEVQDDNAPEIAASANLQSLRFLFRSLLSSKFTMLLLVSNFMMQLLLVITEYNVLSAFQERFAINVDKDVEEATEAALTKFMGQWVAIISFCNIIFGLFIYSRLVRRFGVTMLVFLTPLILVMTFGGWMFSNLLLFPIMGYFVVEGTLIVIDDSNFALLLNAVPQKVKYKIRVIIESFFEPIGMLVSSLLLSFSPINSKFLGLILSIGALLVALGLRKQYLHGLFRNLSENAIHMSRQVKDWLAAMKPKEIKASEMHLLAILKQGDDRAKIFACEGLLEFEDEALLKQMLRFADQMSVSAKIAFLSLISRSPLDNNPQVLDHLHKWYRDEHDNRLKSEIQLYLAKLGLIHPEKAIADLENENLKLHAAAVISLKTSLAQQSPSAAAYNRILAAQEIETLLDSTSEEKIALGVEILGLEYLSSNVDILLPFLKSPSLKIMRAASQSICQIIDKESIRHIPFLISQLALTSDHEVRISLLKALEITADSTHVKDIIAASLHFRPNERRRVEDVIFKMGLRTVPSLISITKDASLHDRSRMLAGKILGRLAPPQLRANLYEIIKVEIERAYFYFYHHHTVQEKYPDLDLKLLVDGLMTGYHSVIDFIIQMLGAAGSIEDVELLSHSLRSHNLKTRSQVVEAIEKTCDIQIFRLLQPLVADYPLTEKLKVYVRGGRPELTLYELLDRLNESPSQADQIIAATYKYRLNLPNWRSSLRRNMSSNEELFHHFAYELLESEG